MSETTGQRDAMAAQSPTSVGKRWAARRRATDQAAGSKVPLFAFVGCSVLVMNGDTIKFAFLPLYLANQLGVSDTVRGAVIAVQPLVGAVGGLSTALVGVPHVFFVSAALARSAPQG